MSIFPEGTIVCLNSGGPRMTVEVIEGDSGFNLVRTVWFVGDICYRDAFHRSALLLIIPPPPDLLSIKGEG